MLIAAPSEQIGRVRSWKKQIICGKENFAELEWQNSMLSTKNLILDFCRNRFFNRFSSKDGTKRKLERKSYKASDTIFPFVAAYGQSHWLLLSSATCTISCCVLQPFLQAFQQKQRKGREISLCVSWELRLAFKRLWKTAVWINGKWASFRT